MSHEGVFDVDTVALVAQIASEPLFGRVHYVRKGDLHCPKCGATLGGAGAPQRLSLEDDDYCPNPKCRIPLRFQDEI